ncbi:unnamed protein product [Phytomonas sp. EM1]|nr:unnamed protein product [Phytomonas sp. EM1]|eukprot:CCW65841.1 unnamed protein product [Phytomonas sp. isolate EM1]
MCELTFTSPSQRARVQPLHDECRPELFNVDFDLSFRAFGIRNSELLRRYLLNHPCARPGAIVLKDWSKTSGVNNSVNGYLTSYAINIMWIYFLVQKGVVAYVDPIEDIPESLRCYREELAKGPRYRPMLDPAWSAAERAALEREAGRLLMEFFLFYAHEFDWANHVVSLNRKGITTKRMLGWDSEAIAPLSPTAAPPSGGARRGGNLTRYSFCIEDPYEENLNLGRHMGITKSLRVRAEFCRALLSLCKDGESESCVFVSADRGRTASRTNPGALPGSSSSLLTAPRGQLPFKVLYRLMAVCTREMALARQRQTGSPSIDAGVPEEELRQAFQSAAAVEFQLASKAWNWQQLVHRLGFKIHRGVVLPRREIGARRFTAPPPAPEGGEDGSASSSSASPISSSSSPGRESGRRGDDTAGGLANAMVKALSEGFLRLTPEWVAWSTPWAALHLRRQPFFTPPARPKGDGESAEGAREKASNTAVGNPAGGVKIGVGEGENAGLLKPTRRHAARWEPPAAFAPTALTLAPRQRGFSIARLMRGLLHR